MSSTQPTASTSPSYTHHTVPNLKYLLKSRSLPISGIKATLIARLEASDASLGQSATLHGLALNAPRSQAEEHNDDSRYKVAKKKGKPKKIQFLCKLVNPSTVIKVRTDRYSTEEYSLYA